jgi:hypothetical protein
MASAEAPAAETVARGRAVLVFLAIGLLVTTVSACSEDRPGADGAVEFSIWPLQYRVPRNVLRKMSNSAGGPQISVSIEVEYPTARPTKQRNEACLQGQPPCKLIEVEISSSWTMSLDEGFEPMQKAFNKQPSKGPFGYEFFSWGPEDRLFNLGRDLRSTYYRKVEGEQIFAFLCLDEPKRVDACLAYSRASSGAIVSYAFPRDLLQDIDRFDVKLRELIDSFVITSGSR